MDKLVNYPWPGNVRELRNIIEYSVITTEGRALQVELHNQDADVDQQIGTRLEDVEREHILKILEQTNWRIRGNGGAAELLGLNESTLRFRMKKLGIEKLG